MEFDRGRLERFFLKVVKQEPDECWEWKGCRRGNGYGGFWNNSKQIYAHRFSWLVHHGSIPEGKLVLHKCNNKGCVNPNHLYLGDYSDNMMDALLANPPLHLCARVREERRQRRIHG